MSRHRSIPFRSPRTLVVGALLSLSMSQAALAQERRPKVIQLEEIKIEGRVQKPNAFYILNRSNIGYQVMELRTSFIDEVIKSVRREPF